MLLNDVLNAALYGSGAFMSAFAALAIIAKRAGDAGADASEFSGQVLVFLIRHGTLVDANFPARRYLDALPDAACGLDRLRADFGTKIDGSDHLFSADPDIGDLADASHDGTWQVVRETTSDTIRIKIIPQRNPEPGAEDVHRLNALEAELSTLRANTEAAPFLAWRQNCEGEITWVNRSFLNLVDRRFGPKRRLTWPLPHLFTETTAKDAANADWPRRLSICDNEDAPISWFDCYATRVGSETLFTAFNTDEAVRAERQLHDFTQTLTKTFADLTVGLAIFDRSRHLVLFNPALAELSNLPVDFLTGRPTLVNFLDGLRERRMMPEPKDYRSWRTSIAELEAAAADGLYCDTWSLPDNQTYRVTGRPHPDGAIAIIFEDITDEMSLTRHFRAKLELQNSVIDNLEDAVAVFASSGALTMWNKAYCALWEVPIDDLDCNICVTDATRQWHDKALPTPTWGDFRDFVQTSADRSEWAAQIKLCDGRDVACRFLPANGGATLAVFRVSDNADEPVSELRKAV